MDRLRMPIFASIFSYREEMFWYEEAINIKNHTGIHGCFPKTDKIK